MALFGFILEEITRSFSNVICQYVHLMIRNLSGNCYKHVYPYALRPHLDPCPHDTIN